jgi:hypothetical protein
MSENHNKLKYVLHLCVAMLLHLIVGHHNESGLLILDSHSY